MKRSNTSKSSDAPAARKNPKLSQSQRTPASKSHIRVGKIVRMQLKNFMCHSNLVVDFNQRTNLLVGNNGSGKSAVITALIIGLGAKASTTNRSKSIKRKSY